jgi:putative peptidoglycan lipid II flippase
VPTAVSAGNLAVTAIAAAALYGPFGVGGIVAATAIATAASTIAYAIVLRGQLHGIEFGRLLWSTIRILLASALLAGISYLTWVVLKDALGTGLLAQIISLGAALLAGAVAYFLAVIALRVPEADQVLRLVRRAGRVV